MPALWAAMGHHRKFDRDIQASEAPALTVWLNHPDFREMLIELGASLGMNTPPPTFSAPLILAPDNRNPHAVSARRALFCEHLSKTCPTAWADWSVRYNFWLFQGDAARGNPEGVAWLPAIGRAIERENNPKVMRVFVDWPLPEVLPPEVGHWHDALMIFWDYCYWFRADEFPSVLSLRAMIKLDACGVPGYSSYIEDHLFQAEKFLEALEGNQREIGVKFIGADPDVHLVEVAAWKPSPILDVNPQTLRKWFDFWNSLKEKGRENDFSEVTYVIATQALLNLVEVNNNALLPIPEIDPSNLLRDLIQWLSVAKGDDLEFLAFWRPGPKTPLPLPILREVAEAWLKHTKNDDLAGRRKAWQMLIDWERSGLLVRCGIDLLPHVVTAIQK